MLSKGALHVSVLSTSTQREASRLGMQGYPWLTGLDLCGSAQLFFQLFLRPATV